MDTVRRIVHESPCELGEGGEGGSERALAGLFFDSVFLLELFKRGVLREVG